MEAKIMILKKSEKQRSSYDQKDEKKIIYVKKKNVKFDTQSVTVVPADGALLDVNPEKRQGRLLFFHHIPNLDQTDENGKKQLMNRCTIEVRMDLSTLTCLAYSILEGAPPIEKREKKQASIDTTETQEKTESPMFG